MPTAAHHLLPMNYYGLLLQLLPLFALIELVMTSNNHQNNNNLNPKPGQFVNEIGSVPRFQSPSRAQDHLLLLLQMRPSGNIGAADSSSILIGGRDALYNLSASTLEVQHTINWKAPGQTIEECHMKGKSESECHNFIRVASPLRNGRVLLCGTHAFSPQCRQYEFTTAAAGSSSSDQQRFVEKSQFNGQAISPYDARQNATFTYLSDLDAIFVGAISDFSASDPLIYRKQLDNGDALRTQKDDRVIDEPNFVGSFAFGDYVYFWYREKAADAMDNNREAQYYSRVGRVCAKDPGGQSPAQDRWSSFLKARLNCSIVGSEGVPFYFNEIQAISEPVPADGGADAIVYAIFHTSRSLPMSAVCSFRMSQIDAIFDHGRFKTQRSPTSMWTPFQKFYPNPGDRPGRCVLDPKRQSTDLSLISKNPLMYDTIPSIGQRPLLIEGPNRADMTAIAIAAHVESVRKQKYNTIYVGKADGTMSKLTEISANGSAYLVETVRVFAASSSSEQSAAIHGMQTVLNSDGQGNSAAAPQFLVVASQTQLAKLPLHHCGMAADCAKCVGLRDPHCAWDIELRKCVNKRDWSSGSFVQNVLLGQSEQCPGATNLLGAEGGAAYVIDEDVIGGGDIAANNDWRAAAKHQMGRERNAGSGVAGNVLLADDPADLDGAAGQSGGLDALAQLYSASSLSVLVILVLVATLFGFLIGWRISKWRMLTELARNTSPGSTTSSNSSDYADGLGPPRTRLARQDSAENKMMFESPPNVYSVGPRSIIGNGDTVSLVMSQRSGVHHMVPMTSISIGGSRAGSGFTTPRHDARYQTASIGATLPRDYRVKKVYL